MNVIIMVIVYNLIINLIVIVKIIIQELIVMIVQLDLLRMNMRSVLNVKKVLDILENIVKNVIVKMDFVMME